MKFQPSWRVNNPVCYSNSVKGTFSSSRISAEVGAGHEARLRDAADACVSPCEIGNRVMVYLPGDVVSFKLAVIGRARTRGFKSKFAHQIMMQAGNKDLLHPMFKRQMNALRRLKTSCEFTWRRNILAKHNLTRTSAPSFFIVISPEYLV